MLRINRARVREPEPLASDGARVARRRIAEYMRRDPAYREQRRIPLDESLYEAPEVASALRELFRDKCAYCEREVTAENGGPAHFRPLGHATDMSGEDSRDHYGWLAYDWTNLLLSCSACDKAKGDKFPVIGRRAPRLTLASDVEAIERRELVDPTRDEPSRHLRFLANGRCRSVDRMGAVTIATLGLNRGRLLSGRKEAAANMRKRFERAIEGPRGDAYRLLLDTDRQFPGTLLDILHRTLLRWGGASSRIPARTALPTWLANELGSASEQGRRALVEAFGQVFAEDLADEAEEEQPGPPPGPPDRGGGAHRRRAPPPRREIESIELLDFRGVRNLSLRMRGRRARGKSMPCMMLLGENSAGKSSVLEGVALALVGSRAASGTGVDASDLVRRDDATGWNVIDPRDAVATVTFQDDAEVAEARVDALGRGFGGSPTPACMVLAYGPRRFFRRGKSVDAPSPRNQVRGLFTAEWSLSDPGVWLATLDGESFAAVARALRVILSLHEDDELLLDDAERVCVRASGGVTPVDRLSEGYRSLFGLSVDIMRNLLDRWPDLERAQAVVLIDEIETHLHPRWKMRIMSSLRRAMPNVQFIVTTHDPLCLRGMDDGEVEVLQKDGSGEVYRLDDLPSVRGMRAEQILTSELFGLSSTADPELDWEIDRMSMELASVADPFVTTDREDDDALVRRLVVGDTARQQIIHEALDRYLEERETRRGARTARRDAVEAVLDVLRDEDGPAAGRT